jgi:hypothetical protein
VVEFSSVEYVTDAILSRVMWIPSSAVQLVQIEVSPTHPLLLLKRALPWEAIIEVMTRHWREHGKNVDGGPGLPWDVSLYVPLVVLMLIKGFDSRQMEAYLAENVVARVFIGRHQDIQAQIRDHSNIARAYPYSDISTEMFVMPIGVFFIGCISYKQRRDVSGLSYPTEPRCPAQL